MKNKKVNQMKKIVLSATALALVSLTATIGFTESNNGMLSNNATVQKAKKAISDTMITGKIKAKYGKSDLLSTLNVQVKTVEKNVYLSGTVDTDMQYEQAVMLAESVDGVKNVNAEQLKVKDSQQPIKDTYITAKVKGQLLKDKILGKNVQVWAVSVETKDGVVYLKGDVDSKTQKDNIIKAVKSVEGVKSVQSEIKVFSESTDANQGKTN